MNRRTKLLLKYCKDAKSKRGLEYVMQIDSDSFQIDNATVTFSTCLYVHTQFLSLHLRKITRIAGRMVDSFYG